ncbi:MAG TPA: hypothetical protein VEG37_07425 [Burkholderiales bacterium]|nr:hypothetical protein [Burkholderiales bacterium]
MSTRTYTLGLLVSLALLLALVAGFNRVIDPFWYYRDIQIPGLNAVKPRFAPYERHVKPQLLARIHPQAIVIGSSLTEIGFDTNDPALTEGGKLSGYNFAFAGAGWDLTQCYFQYAAQATDLKRVAFEIQPQAMPGVDCTHRLAEIENFSQVKFLLSVTALNDSLRTVFEQHRGRSSHTREGRFLYARGDFAYVLARFREIFLGRVRSTPQCTLAHIPDHPPPSAQFLSIDITPRPGLDLTGLRSMLQTARARGIKLRLFLPPEHALLLELHFLCGTYAQRWADIAAIARVVAEEAHDGDIQLWDFYGYNDWTGESVVGHETVYWQDPYHLNYELGSLMLAEMFGDRPEGPLGHRITPTNVAEAYHEFLASRTRYLATHPGFYKELRTTLAPRP